MDLERWEYAPASGGTYYFLRDLRKAKPTKAAAAKIERAMSRIETGTARSSEFEHVRDGVCELRIDADGRWYRVMYGEVNGKFVALSLILKKTNKLRPQDVDTAINRLKEYRKVKG